MDMPHCIYPLIADRCLSSFHFVAILSDATIEIHIQVLVCKYVCVCVCVCVLISFGDVTRSRMDELYNK